MMMVLYQPCLQSNTVVIIKDLSGNDEEEDLDESEGAGGGGPGLQNVSRVLAGINRH